MTDFRGDGSKVQVQSVATKNMGANSKMHLRAHVQKKKKSKFKSRKSLKKLIYDI